MSVSLHVSAPAVADRCLWIYPEEEWARVEADLNRFPAGDKNGQRLRKVLLSAAYEAEMDDAGRLVIPPRLREYATLEKGVMLVGQGRKLELWDEETWNRSFEQALEEGFLEENGELSAALQALVL